MQVLFCSGYIAFYPFLLQITKNNTCIEAKTVHVPIARNIRSVQILHTSPFITNTRIGISSASYVPFSLRRVHPTE